MTEDADLFCLQEKKILFFTKNNEEFNTYNLIRMFTFIKKLGEGGFGKVYLVKQKMTNTKYAIKFLRYNFLNVKDVSFLYKEIEVLMRLEHSNIIKLYSYFATKDNNNIALIMEYLSGGTLRQYIKQHQNRKLAEYETRNITYQILQIISYCHKMNIIHHDLKPDNILFTDNSHTCIKIIDFGISSLMNSKNRGGSLIYLPPEIINGEDYRSVPSVDMWSIGCIFGEMLIGKFLFKGNDVNETKNLIKCGKFNIPKFVFLSDNALDLLKKMLEIDPNKRITVDESLQHPFFNEIDDEENLINFEENNDNINYNYFRTNNKFFGNRTNNKHHTVKTGGIFNFAKVLESPDSKAKMRRNCGNKKKTIKVNFDKTKYDYKYNFINNNLNNPKNKLSNRFLGGWGIEESYHKRIHSNKSKHNIFKKSFVTNNSIIFQNNGSAPKNIKKHIITDENNEEKNNNNNNNNNDNISSKQNKVVNFSSRENMAREKLMLNLRKVENYKKELEQVKSTRNCFGNLNTNDNRIVTPYKPTKFLVTKITNQMSEDELITYWINLTIKYKGNVPSFLKPIGLTREQKKRIEKFTQGMGKTKKYKKNNGSLPNMNENIILDQQNNNNNYIKIKTNKSANGMYKSPTKTKKMHRSSDKIILPKVK